MADVPEFTVRPPLRCFGLRKDQPGVPCARPAIWQRRAVHGFEPAYFCDDCRQPTDEPIAETPVFRRVQVMCEVLFSGTSLLERTALREAVGQLERAVEAAGGVLNVHDYRSAVGRHAAPAAPRKANGGDGKGQTRPLRH